jgi:ribose transport system permease protein
MGRYTFMKLKELNYKQVLSKIGPLLALILLCIFWAFMSENFLTYSNITNILKQVSINCLLAAGMLVVILTGGIDLSVGSILGLSICSMGVALNMGITNSFALLVICLAVGALLGLLNGLMLTVMKLPHPFISTLGMTNAARGLALIITAGIPISGFPKALQFPGYASFNGLPASFFIVIIIFILFHIFLTKTAVGRQIYSIGGNREAARLAGINTKRVLTLVYVISGIMSAFAGIIFIGRLNTAPPLAGTGYELDAIAACIIGGASFSGGKGTIWGTLVGCVMIAVIRNGLNLVRASADLQMVIIGLIIVLAVFVDVVRTDFEKKSKRIAAAK